VCAAKFVTVCADDYGREWMDTARMCSQPTALTVRLSKQLCGDRWAWPDSDVTGRLPVPT
jgi:hypothetical protein